MERNSSEEPKGAGKPPWAGGSDLHQRRRLVAVGIVVAVIALVVAVVLIDPFGGGDDAGDAEQVVRDFVRATNERDADALCEELLTDEFVEQATGATGGRARDACKQQLRATQELMIDLRSIRSTEVDGDNATVVALIEVQGQEQRRTFRLQMEDGDWRLAGGTGSAE
jgi:hypothetical protein